MRTDFWFPFKKFVVTKGLDHFRNKSNKAPDYQVLFEKQINQEEGLVICFAHFSTKGNLSEATKYYITELKKHFGGTIVFITSSPTLDKSSIQFLEKKVSILLTKENLGLDFGSWNIGLNHLKNKTVLPNTVLLTNDSILGPLFNLGEIASQIKESQADIVGLVDSSEISYHLQSFFLHLGPKALRSTVFQDFLNNFSWGYSRRSIIWNYEIGLTQALLAEGLTGQVLFSLKSSLQSGSNPTMKFPKELVDDKAFPFLKRKVYEDSPEQWLEFIRTKNKTFADVLDKS